MLEAQTHQPGSPPITQIAFLTCRAHYPGGPNRCVSVSFLSARPSPVNRRVGIHDFTFEACSSFTRVTACKVACPPKGGCLSRGFDPASYPTEPLGSYHVLPRTTWMDPPSISDLRRWGALLTTGWGCSSGPQLNRYAYWLVNTKQVQHSNAQNGQRALTGVIR
jgi:hypothetical protein